MLAATLARIGTVAALAGRVSIAVTAKDVLAQEHTGPRAWLCEPRGSTAPNETLGGITRQNREQRFALLTLVSGDADVTDAGLLAASEALRRDCWTALIGWQPSGEYAPLELVRDALAKAADGQIYWVDEFKTSHQLVS